MFQLFKNLFKKQPQPSAKNDKIDKYDVYIFQPNPNKDAAPTWQHVGATHCARRAKARARLLHKKQKYERVEIKKCAYNANENRYLCKTVRVYNKKQPCSWESFIHAVISS